MENPKGEQHPTLFHADDFGSLNTSISLHNTTTQTEIINGSRTMAGQKDTSSLGKDLSILLVEAPSEDAPPALTLEVPHRTCAQGHTLLIDVKITGPRGLQFDLGVPTRVQSCEKVAEYRDRIVAALVQPDLNNWKRFLAVFSARQSEVEELFGRMKDIG